MLVVYLWAFVHQPYGCRTIITHMRINHLKDRIIPLRNMPGKVCGERRIVDIVGCLHLPQTESGTGEGQRDFRKPRSSILRIDRDHMHCGCLESSIHTALRFEMQIAAALPGQERHEREPHIENNPDRAS